MPPLVPLGKEQIAFNKLIRKVNALRAKLAEWAAFEPLHNQRVVNELLPLQQRYAGVRRATILTVAAILTEKAPAGSKRKAERRNLQNYLVEMAGIHLDENPDDAEITALHDQYADISFAESQAFDREIMRSIAEDLFDVELDDEQAAGSLDDIFEASFAKARVAAEDEAGAAFERRAQGRRGGKAEQRRQQKAASAEQAAREVSQSVREIFRKLASALHPDRAADEADRTRRHDLMQRVNHAYDKGDLLTLLTLQLETEQIDAEHLAQVSKARLGHYNKVLREQVKELEQELAAVTGHFAMLVERAASRLTPIDVQDGLNGEIAALEQEIRDLEAHQAMLLHAEPRRLWLQQYAKEQREEERLNQMLIEAMGQGANPFDFDFDFDFDPFSAQPPPSRRPRSAKKRRKSRR